LRKLNPLSAEKAFSFIFKNSLFMAVDCSILGYMQIFVRRRRWGLVALIWGATKRENPVNPVNPVKIY
jgi:hypothetical protein